MILNDLRLIYHDLHISIYLYTVSMYLYIYGALWGPRVPIYGALWGPRVPGLMDPGPRVPGLRDPGPRVPGLRDPGPRVPGLRDPGLGAQGGLTQRFRIERIRRDWIRSGRFPSTHVPKISKKNAPERIRRPKK